MRLSTHAAALLTLASAAAVALGCSQLAVVPAYFDPQPSSPTDLWREAVAAGSPACITLVMNPDSGPGPSFSKDYATDVAFVRGKGAKGLYVCVACADVGRLVMPADVLLFTPRSVCVRPHVVRQALSSGSRRRCGCILYAATYPSALS
jgi:hypothetical protein